MDEARASLQRLLGDFQAARPELIDELTWTTDGNSATASGFKFNGNFARSPDSLTVEINLPWYLGPVAPLVEAELDKALKADFPPEPR
jgi:hypothetical protein